MTAVNMVMLTEKISGGHEIVEGRERDPSEFDNAKKKKKKEEKRNNRRNTRTRSISIMQVYIKAAAALILKMKNQQKI